MSANPPIISATAIDGLRIKTAQGKPAALAVIDGSGNVIESGPELADAVFDMVVECYCRFLTGKGALRVMIAQPDASQDESHKPGDGSPAQPA
jgi:hypothetical protein